MFDFDVGKLLLIGVVALIFIPPKDLPNALRQLGRLIGQARRMAADFQGQFSEALREAELSDIKDELHNLKQKASVEDAFSHVADMLETKVDVPASAKVPGETPAAAEAPDETPGLSHSAGALGPTLPTAEPLATPQPEPLPEPLPLPEASKPGPGNAP